MSRTVLSATVEGLRRELHDLRRSVMDLKRDQSWRFDAPEVEAAAAAGTPDMVWVREGYATGVNAGTFTAGAWRTRNLNLVGIGQIAGASLSAGQLTLPPGTYRVAGASGAVAYSVDQHQTRLRRTGVTLIVGSTAYAAAGVASWSWIPAGEFTLTATSAIELQHYCQTTKTSNGFGAGGGLTGTGEPNRFADLVLHKIA